MRTVEDRLIDKLEAAETQKYAKRQRRDLGWQGSDRVDPLSLASVSHIWTVRGRAPFRLQFVDDHITNRRGNATYDGSAFVVEIPESIRRKAFFGDGHARFTVAREFGHATLRHPETRAALMERFRRQPDGGDARKVLVSGSASLDFQAGVFASALIIGDDATAGAVSPEELSVRYGIDALSARVYFAELRKTAA
jgi:hypothetical protein